MKRGYRLGAAALAAVALGAFLMVVYTPAPLTDCREVTDGWSSVAERHATFFHDGAEVLTISVLASPYTAADPGPAMHRLLVSVAHPQETHVDAVAVDIRFPGTGTGRVYLEVPGGNPYPPIDVNRPLNDGGSDRRIAIADMGLQGEGTVAFEFLVRPDGATDQPVQLSVAVETTVSETTFPWRRYEARHRIPVEV